jgi:hypothetical protein
MSRRSKRLTGGEVPKASQRRGARKQSAQTRKAEQTKLGTNRDKTTKGVRDSEKQH